MKRAFILHGGAGHYDKGSIGNSLPFLKSIFEESLDILNSQGASEAVLHAVRRMENHEDYNAGTGSKLQADGAIRMTACYMDSKLGRFSSVVNISRIKNPIDAAFRLQQETYPNLAGDEGTRFFRKLGFADHDPLTERQLEIFKKKSAKPGGTVGACALDLDGILAAATSTGGTGMETPGRVSDDASPCGNYCSSQVAISATGIGETFIDTAIVPKLAGLLDYGIPAVKAFDHISNFFRANGGEGGFIAVTHEGQIYLDYNTIGMRYYGIDKDNNIMRSE